MTIHKTECIVLGSTLAVAREYALVRHLPSHILVSPKTFDHVRGVVAEQLFNADQCSISPEQWDMLKQCFHFTKERSLRVIPLPL